MSLNLQYGQHIPHGAQAFYYSIGPFGMWKPLDAGIEYIWNYYDFPKPLPPKHPYDKDELISYSNGSFYTTCRDANAHLLLDFDHDGELDLSSSTGFAFHEHAGRGEFNELKGLPFTNFWFDDNSLAMHMNKAFDFESPTGLSQYEDFTRWQIVGGDTSNWTPYTNPDGFPDQLALNGLFHLSSASPSLAKDDWKKILALSKYEYVNENQRFEYPGIGENYHMGLWLSLTSFLLKEYPDDGELVQHWVALRSNVISNQVRDANADADGPFHGWTSDINNKGSLMNIESIAVNVLGLGAGHKWVYEAGRQPLLFSKDSSFYLRPHNVLSAVGGLSKEGFMVEGGPHVPWAPGNYSVTFIVRSPQGTSAGTEDSFPEEDIVGPDSISAPLFGERGIGRSPYGDSADLLTVEVLDVAGDRALSMRRVGTAELVKGNQWTKVTLAVEAPVGVPLVDLRVWWHGNGNVDIACITLSQQ